MISVLEIEDRVGEMVQQVKGLAGQAWQLNLNFVTHVKGNIWSCASAIPVLLQWGGKQRRESLWSSNATSQTNIKKKKPCLKNKIGGGGGTEGKPPLEGYFLTSHACHGMCTPTYPHTHSSRDRLDLTFKSWIHLIRPLTNLYSLRRNLKGKTSLKRNMERKENQVLGSWESGHF